MHKAKKEENSFTVNGYYTVDLLGSWQEHPDGLDLVAYSIFVILCVSLGYCTVVHGLLSPNSLCLKKI